MKLEKSAFWKSTENQTIAELEHRIDMLESILATRLTLSERNRVRRERSDCLYAIDTRLKIEDYHVGGYFLIV